MRPVSTSWISEATALESMRYCVDFGIATCAGCRSVRLAQPLMNESHTPRSISAIDNALRRLIEMGQEPVTVGLYFSLGHSTVVCAAVIA